MIVTVGPRRVAVLPDEPTARYTFDRVRTESVAGAAPSPCAQKTRAAVEILRQGGGLAPRALLGGVFSPAPGDLVIEVNSSADMTEPRTTCRSHLWRPLVPGLPAEFVDSVTNGLLRRVSLQPGILVIDRAGFDVIESSPLAFELAAELLVAVLAARVGAGDVGSVVRESVGAWP